MKRIKFRLEPLIAVHQQSVQQAQKSVAEAIQALQILEARREAKEGEIADLKTELSQQLSGRVSVDAVLDRGRFEMNLLQDRAELTGQIAQIEQELEKRREKLREADLELKRIEKMKKLAARQHDQQAARELQRELDETAGTLRLLQQSEESV